MVPEDPPRRFELEDEPERPPTPVPPAPEPESGEDGEAQAEVPPSENVAESAPALRTEPTGEGEVDTRTVAERLGTDVPRGHAVVPPPADWPQDLWRYPMRGQGPALAGAMAAAFVVLDLLGVVPLMRFPAWGLKLLAYVWVLAVGLRLIGSSAAGHDAPKDTERAAEVKADTVWAWVGTVCFLMPLWVPPGLLLFLDVWWTWPLFLIGCAWGAVCILALALADRRQAWPWHALRWWSQGTLHLGVATGALLFCGLVEYAMAWQQDAGFVLTLVIGILLRAVQAGVILAGARALGVLGRRYTVEA